MLEGAFTFRGRIGRMQFFIDGLLSGVGCVVAAIVLAFLVVPARHDAIGIAFFIACFALAGLVVLWFSLSLYVRRIRDIGWDPVVVIGGWIVGNLADAVLAGLVPGLAVGAAHHATIIGSVANPLLSLALLFWPGHDGPDHDAGSAPPRRARAAFAPAAPVATASPHPARQRTGFGRRGAA